MSSSPPLYGRLISLNPAYPNVPLSKREFVIGRHASCDLCFDHASVSKMHCKIIFSDGIYIQDLSSFGTWLNRSALIGKSNVVPLKNGDEISLILPRSRHMVFGDDIISFVFQDLTSCGDLVVHQMEEAGVQKVYTFLKELGGGTFGVVWLGRAVATGDRVALKIVNKGKFLALGGSSAQMMMEVHVLDKLRHPNIIEIQAVMETDKFLVIALEFASGGDLFGLMRKRGRLSEAAARLIFHSILSALSYLHANNVMHRDLKPENILLTGPEGETPRVKLADFGLARVLGERALASTVCGTPLYIAPEVLIQGICPGKGYHTGSDLWSAGVILYELLCGAPPFSTAPGALPLHRQICFALRPDFKLAFPPGLSASSRDLLSKLITPVASRISADQAMHHPWLKEGRAESVPPEWAADLTGPSGPASDSVDMTPGLCDSAYGDKDTNVEPSVPTVPPPEEEEEEKPERARASRRPTRAATMTRSRKTVRSPAKEAPLPPAAAVRKRARQDSK